MTLSQIHNTAKSRALRIPLDYDRAHDIMRSWRVWLAGAGLVGALLWGGYGVVAEHEIGEHGRSCHLRLLAILENKQGELAKREQQVLARLVRFRSNQDSKGCATCHTVPLSYNKDP